ncbi:MAG: M20/M25/M40 family metallo-hydrolase [Pseudomonadota bacterium]
MTSHDETSAIQISEQTGGQDEGASPFVLLEDLLSIPAVPGRERLIREAIERRCKNNGGFDSVETDPLGSLLVRRAPTRPGDGKPLRVLFAAHMDQIGFLVSHIEEGGFLRLHPVGAFDPRTMLARSVRVVTESGPSLSGVLYAEGRPLHTAPNKDLETVPGLETFFVDLSMPESEVRDQVKLGDMVVYAPSVQRVGASIVASGLDDRAGCWAILVALEQATDHSCEIVAAFSAQEEVGSRGAVPLGYAVDADIAIACDTTVCSALPGTAPQHHVTKAGAGVSIQIADASTISDHSLVNKLETLAKERSIPCQRSLMMGGGQDGARLQVARRGVPTIVISCPIKYLHTATEMAHTVDLESYRDLLAAAMETL